MKDTMLICALVSLSLIGVAQAKTLEWDRNSEPDMKDYQIWICATPNCVVVKSAATLKATVPHTPVGKVPSWVMPDAIRDGAVAVSARDKSLNETALSVPLSFDSAAPKVPTNPRFK